MSKDLPAIHLGDEEADREQWRQFVRDAFILVAGITIGAVVVVIGVAAAAMRA